MSQGVASARAERIAARVIRHALLTLLADGADHGYRLRRRLGALLGPVWKVNAGQVYRALDQLPQIKDSLIVNLEYPDGTDWMPLFVTLQEGAVCDEALVSAVKKILRQTYSPRHVPDDVIPVPDIPYTISGKKMETPVKKILQRKPLEKAFNKDSMKNPECMEFFMEFAKKYGR